MAVCAGLALGAGATAAKPARPLVPAGGVWQSIPHTPEADGAPSASDKPAFRKAPKPAASAKPRRIVQDAKAAKAAKAARAAKAAKIAAPRKVQPQRHPVAAAAVAKPPPRDTAAARTKELERRLDVLMPGTKLGAVIEDPHNPSWRRARPGQPAGESNSLSLPFDEKGQAGFLARGYHAQPDVQNPHGNTGATFGLRTKF